MSYDKELPLLPLRHEKGRLSNTRTKGADSPSTMEALLEENQQLNLTIRQLWTEKKALDHKYHAEVQRRRRLEEKTNKNEEEIKLRDRTLNGIMDTIVDEFRRFRVGVLDVRTEEIRVFSRFDDDSPQ